MSSTSLYLVKINKCGLADYVSIKCNIVDTCLHRCCNIKQISSKNILNPIL